MGQQYLYKLKTSVMYNSVTNWYLYFTEAQSGHGKRKKKSPSASCYNEEISSLQEKHLIMRKKPLLIIWKQNHIITRNASDYYKKLVWHGTGDRISQILLYACLKLQWDFNITVAVYTEFPLVCAQNLRNVKCQHL